MTLRFLQISIIQDFVPNTFKQVSVSHLSVISDTEVLVWPYHTSATFCYYSSCFLFFTLKPLHFFNILRGGISPASPLCWNVSVCCAYSFFWALFKCPPTEDISAHFFLPLQSILGKFLLFILRFHYVSFTLPPEFIILHIFSIYAKILLTYSCLGETQNIHIYVYI